MPYLCDELGIEDKADAVRITASNVDPYDARIFVYDHVDFSREHYPVDAIEYLVSTQGEINREIRTRTGSTVLTLKYSPTSRQLELKLSKSFPDDAARFTPDGRFPNHGEFALLRRAYGSDAPWQRLLGIYKNCFEQR